MPSLIPLNIINDLKKKLFTQSLFITGGTGFFGRSILDFFVEQELFELNITLLTRDPQAFNQQYKQYHQLKNLKFHQGDIQTFEFPKKNYDQVIHLATPASAAMNISDPITMADIILIGTRRILEFSKHIQAKNILFASSGAVYGKQPSNLENTPETYAGAPLIYQSGAAYGEAKRMAELLGCEYSRKHGIPFKIARCFAFVGPHLDKTGSFAIGNFIRDANAGVPISISGDGTPLRSYLYSEDLVVWLFTILFNGNNNEPYNVGSDQSISIADLAEAVTKAINPSLEVKIAKKPHPDTPLERYVPSIEKARKDLGLAVWTDLKSAILKSK